MTPAYPGSLQDRRPGPARQRAGLAAAALTMALLGPAAAGGQATWAYAGPNGPGRWAALDPAWTACAAGQQQSPVAIPADAPRAGLATLRYEARPVRLRDTGHTLQLDVDSAAGGVTVDGMAYSLLQLHVHAPSEHLVAGRHAAAELHLVHRNAAGALAVVGVLVDSGPPTPALDALFADLPAPGAARALPDPFDVTRVLPPTRQAWRYAGSLTTPPCTEGVTWLVLDTPITASAGQLHGFLQRYPASNRPPQPLGARRFQP